MRTALPATVETVAGFVAAADAAPEELTTIANVMPCPPLPFVPAELQGRMVIFANFVKPMPPSGMYPPQDPDYRPSAVGTTMFVESIGPAEAATAYAHRNKCIMVNVATFFDAPEERDERAAGRSEVDVRPREPLLTQPERSPRP